MDLSKAFDSISHKLLIEKLKNYNLYNDWFDNYLTDRFQLTKIGHFESTMLPVEYGVPQGSILGPVLFNIFINEIKQFIQQFRNELVTFEVVGYADDTQIILSSNFNDYWSLKSFAEMLTDQLISWFTTLRLKINIDKTQCLLISTNIQSKKIDSSEKYLQINGTKISFADSVTNLGVIFDSNMKFTSHTNNLYKKVYNKLSYLNKTRHFHNYYTRKLLVEHLALSQLNYCRDVWGYLSKSQMDQLQRLTKYGACIILCKNKRDSVNEDIKNLNWLDPCQASDYFAGCLIFKEINGQYNPNIKSLLTLSEGIETRNFSLKLNIPDYRTQYGKRNINFRAIVLWNTMPKDLREINDFKIFKKCLKLFLINGE